MSQQHPFSLVTFSNLRDDELLSILAFMSRNDWLSLKLVSKSFRLSQLSDDDTLWKDYYLTDSKKLIKFYHRLQYKPLMHRFGTPLDASNVIPSASLEQVQSDFKIHLQTLIRPFIELHHRFLEQSRKHVSSLKYEGPMNPFLSFHDLKSLNVVSRKQDHKYKIVFTGDGAVGNISHCQIYRWCVSD